MFYHGNALRIDRIITFLVSRTDCTILTPTNSFAISNKPYIEFDMRIYIIKVVNEAYKKSTITFRTIDRVVKRCVQLFSSPLIQFHYLPGPL